MSKRVLKAAVAGILMVAGAAQASAADLNHYTAPAQAPTNIVNYAFNWTGAYVGANLGSNWANIGLPTGITGNNGNSAALAGGLQAGYLWQTGQIVYGLEGDVDYNGNSKSFSYTNGANTFSEREKLDWSFGARGRLGYAFDRFLPFVSGGITFANLNSRLTNTGTGASDSNSRLRTGFQVGGGLEYAITNNVTARAEYIYSDYGSYTASYPANGVGLRHHVTDDALRFSLNYKF
jgi:outer membrane immunogenic protein